jgi:hypothetical protein
MVMVLSHQTLKKKKRLAWVPVAYACNPWEAEIRKIALGDQPTQKSS